MTSQGTKTSEAEVLQHAANITELMQSEGITLTAAIAKLGLNKQSVISNWPKMYPSFATAIERARDLRQEYLEQHFLKFVRGEAKGSPAAAIFALINCNRASGDWKQSNFSGIGENQTETLKIEHIVRTVVDTNGKIIEGEKNLKLIENAKDEDT